MGRRASRGLPGGEAGGDVVPPKLPRQLSLMTLREGRLPDEPILTQALVQDVDLGGQAVTGVTLEEVHGRRLRLQDVTWPKAHWRDVRLERCDVQQARLGKISAQRVELLGCRITGALIDEGRFDDLLLRDCQGEYVSFAGGTFRRARFERCILRHSSFMECNLDGAIFLDCDLSGADLLGATLVGADVRGSTIEQLRIGMKELPGLQVDLGQAAALLQGFGARVRLD